MFCFIFIPHQFRVLSCLSLHTCTFAPWLAPRQVLTDKGFTSRIAFIGWLWILKKSEHSESERKLAMQTDQSRIHFEVSKSCEIPPPDCGEETQQQEAWGSDSLHQEWFCNKQDDTVAKWRIDCCDTKVGPTDRVTDWRSAGIARVAIRH